MVDASAGGEGRRSGAPPFAAMVAAAALIAVVFVLWVRYEFGGPQATVAFADITSAVVPFAAGLACFWRMRRAHPDLRLAWGLLGAATWAWSAGQVVWAATELRTGEPPAVPSLADAGYLLLLPLAALGLVALVRRPGRRRIDPRPLLDGGIVGSSFMVVAFVFGLERIVLESEAGDAGLIVNLLYPFGDAILVGLATMRLSRAPPAARGVLAFLAGGFVLLAIADLWFLVVDAQGTYATGGILDAFWVMGFLLIGLGALRPATLSSAIDVAPQTTAMALVSIYPFLAGTVAAIYAEIRDGHLSDTLFWSALTVVLLMLARLIVMIMDNFALTRSLREEQSMRSQMLNSITHDMLSPLSAVRIQLALLATDGLGPSTDRQRRALGIVDRNIERVNRLGGDLKDLANLEAKGLAILRGPMDLAAEARRAVTSFGGEATQRGITLDLQAPAAAPMEGDAGRLGQVLDNLIANALKFTKEGGRVTVRLEEAPAGWKVGVTDTGRGLTPEEAARLFRPFTQVHRPGEVKERGTGLGLYISRGIVELHGGTLTVASPGYGLGSTFTFTVPAAIP